MIKSELSSALKHLADLMDRPDWIKVAHALVFIALAGFFAALPAKVIGLVVDTTIANGLSWTGNIAFYILVLVTALLGFEAFQLLKKWLVESVAVKVQAKAQDTFASVLLKLPVDALHGRHIGETLSQIDKGVSGLIKLMKLSLLEFGPALVTALVSVGFVVFQNWQVGVVMVAVVLINVAVTLWQIQSQRGIRINLLERRMEFNGRLGELIMNLESVRATGIATDEEADFCKVTGSLRTTEFKHHLAMMTFDAMKGLCDGGGLVAVLIVSLWFLSSGSMSSGEVLMISLLYQNATAPLKMLHRVVDESYEAAIQVLNAEKLRGIGIDPGLLGIEVINKNNHSHAFEASNLTCGLADGRQILNGLSYVVPRQAFDIIGGETGSGKSTLLRIMLGLVASYSGNARVLGTEVRDVDKQLLSRHVCYVAQDPFIKAGTLRSNLILGLDRDVSDLELVKAAQLACIPIGEEAWVDGLDRKVSERGKGLSGGEVQRIALARAFLSNAELFILDEATSKLDEPIEAIVLGNLSRMTNEKAIVMVAHRATTHRWAKRIFQLEDGQLQLVKDSKDWPQAAE